MKKMGSNSRCIDFAETNHNVLKNAKLFVQEGKNPSNGVYGYSAWNNKRDLYLL